MKTALEQQLRTAFSFMNRCCECADGWYQLLYDMKATGIVHRIDDLGRVVIPKEISRTMRIREGDPLQTTLTPFDRFYIAIHSVVERY